MLKVSLSARMHKHKGIKGHLVDSDGLAPDVRVLLDKRYPLYQMVTVNGQAFSVWRIVDDNGQTKMQLTGLSNRDLFVEVKPHKAGYRINSNWDCGTAWVTKERCKAPICQTCPAQLSCAVSSAGSQFEEYPF